MSDKAILDDDFVTQSDFAGYIKECPISEYNAARVFRFVQRKLDKIESQQREIDDLRERLMYMIAFGNDQQQREIDRLREERDRWKDKYDETILNLRG